MLLCPVTCDYDEDILHDNEGDDADYNDKACHFSCAAPGIENGWLFTFGRMS
jgi:hypothetical protein